MTRAFKHIKFAWHVFDSSDPARTSKSAEFRQKTRRFIADVSMALDGKFTNDLIREMYFKLLLIIVAVYSDEAAANNDGPTVDDMFTPIVAKTQKLTIKSSIAQ